MASSAETLPAEYQKLFGQMVVQALEHAFTVPFVESIAIRLPIGGQKVLTLLNRIQTTYPETGKLVDAYTWSMADPDEEDDDVESAQWALFGRKPFSTVGEALNDAGWSISARLVKES